MLKIEFSVEIGVCLNVIEARNQFNSIGSPLFNSKQLNTLQFHSLLFVALAI